MRTETVVDKYPILAVWMNGAAPYYDEDQHGNLGAAVRKSDMGK